MNAKTALTKHLLSGKTINVKTCFETIGLTNCAREVSRMIEKPFSVIITRTHQHGKTRYGTPCTWYDYKLEHNQANANGIKKMTEYLLQHDDSLQKAGEKISREKISFTSENY